MNLIDASVQFPTVIFTIGLLVALVYWLFVILGALDIDLLGGADDVSGALKGAGEAVTGGVKGAAEAVTGGVKGGAEAAHAHDVGGGLWAWLGLATVPVTVSMSVVLLLTWAGSILAMQYGPHGLGTALAIVMAVAVVLIALPLAGFLVRPLRPVFEVKVGKSNKDYVGATCTITTGHVDDGFGQATIEDGATVLVIPVRCDRAGVLGRGAKALVIDFDPVRHAYVVEPAADLLPTAPTGADRSA
ncbi:MAG: hypothetical protein IPH44_30585 [Myxococcales bacterium]|nr:hypothetical protein [Myxococcales bacterium]MBK7194787.1 hypothetical protein [Myxococcales bacterium]MBP6842421.1 hypothetical protein [Kofleriaceae bacterium]